jgi:uncharacterized membrane protein YhaH (DUF805 family)
VETVRTDTLKSPGSLRRKAMDEIIEVEFQQPAQTGFVSAIKKGFKGYVVWNARSTRSEYWWWVLFTLIVGIVATIIDSVVFGSESMGAGWLSIIATIALFLPGLSLIVRRLHDTDRSGWWFWIILVPIVGVIVLLVFMLLPSKMGPSRWNSRVAA